MPVEFPPEAIEPLKMTKAQLEHWTSISDTESKYLLASRYVALAKSLPVYSYEGANWYKYVLVAHWLLYMIGESNDQLYGVISKLCSWTAHTYELQEENKMLAEEVIRLKDELRDLKDGRELQAALNEPENQEGFTHEDIIHRFKAK